MFIPEFVCGVLFTIVAELLFVVLYAIFGRKDKNKNGR